MLMIRAAFYAVATVCLDLKIVPRLLQFSADYFSLLFVHGSGIMQTTKVKQVKRLDDALLPNGGSLHPRALF